MRRRCRPNDNSTSILPDAWPGTSVCRQDGEFEQAVLLNSGGNTEGATWKRLTIIGRDPLAIAGMRHMLAHGAPIWLRTMTDVPDTGQLVGQDVAIWIRMRHDGMPDLVGHVARHCRNNPALKQLVISDALPASIPPGPGPLSGVWLARGCETREMLYALLRLIMRTPPPTGPMLKKRLGRMQWRVLLLRASGVETSVIADVCGISIKTVSTHESAIRERLGVRGRFEYAWLLRSVAQMQAAVPALCRDVVRLKNRKEYE